jgi:hypothetical protein
VAVFDQARAEPWGASEPQPRALFSIPGSGPQRRRVWRRVAGAGIAVVLLAGNALLIRDVVVTRANADRLPSAQQHAQQTIANRQDAIARAQAALAAATAQLGQATRTRDHTRQSDASARAQAVDRNRQLANVQARIAALHQQIDQLSKCVNDLQGPLNDTSKNSQASCGATG